MRGGILDADTYPTPTFVERQFYHPPTIKQNIFDVALGIIMPVLCFYFDPGILRDGFSGFTMGLPVKQASVFIYILSGLAIPTLALWLWLGPRLKRWGGMVGGVLLAGAILSFTIGIVIFPLTFIGLIVLVGVLGFVPFLTAFVYLRNGLRAIEQANLTLPRFQLVASFLLGAMLAIGIPVIAQQKINQMVNESMAQILRDDNEPADEAISRAKYFKWLIDTRPILLAYDKETNSGRKERLAKAYMEIEGEEIEVPLTRLSD
jgi:hypothetical protein